MQNAKVYLDGIAVQVDTNGVQPHKVSFIDDNRTYLSRESLASVREDDDTIGFDVVMLSGKRRRVYYGETPPTVVVPQNNAAALSGLYRKYKVVAYDINGTGMGPADAAHFYAAYKATQETWAKRARLTAKLSNPDVPVSTRNALIAEFEGMDAELAGHSMTLTMYGSNYTVLFAEGASCNFTDWVIADYTDFRFSLITREVLA